MRTLEQMSQTWNLSCHHHILLATQSGRSKGSRSFALSLSLSLSLSFAVLSLSVHIYIQVYIFLRFFSMLQLVGLAKRLNYKRP